MTLLDPRLGHAKAEAGSFGQIGMTTKAQPVKLRLSSLSSILFRNDLRQKRKRDPVSLQNRETARQVT
jgi:hypothetical protein